MVATGTLQGRSPLFSNLGGAEGGALFLGLRSRTDKDFCVTRSTDTDSRVTCSKTMAFTRVYTHVKKNARASHYKTTCSDRAFMH